MKLAAITLLRQPARLPPTIVQFTAALLAAASTYEGFHRLNQSRQNFNETAGWLGLALLCLAAVAWDWARPHPSTWPGRLMTYVRQRWWEIALLLSIIGLSVFMWTFRFGEYPPSGLICCEERLMGSRGYEVTQGLFGEHLDYPLSRYQAALGLTLFGDNTLGLRFFLILAGILSVPAFYLLLRQLVGAAAALFGTVLLASCWPLMDLRPGPQPQYLAIILFACLLVLGIRRRNAFAFLGAGFLGGLLSYEYESFKPVPIVAGGFLIVLATYSLAYPLPEGLRALGRRARSLVSTHWRSALVFVGAALIVVTPLLVAEREGQNLYKSSLDRQILDRAGQGTPGVFASNWKQQLRWSAEVFLPFGPRTYPRVGAASSTPGTRLVDPITGTFLGLGVVLGVISFYRPFRLLFLIWYLGVLGGAALLAFQFSAAKLYGALPAGFVLAAFVVDDAGRLVGRWGGRTLTYLLPLLLLGSAAYVAYWNADALFAKVGKDPFVLQEYENIEGQHYTLCHYLRQRGDENFSYTFQAFDPTLGFARAHETPAEQQVAWSNYLWACHDLRGRAFAAASEAWPLRGFPAGPLTWAFMISYADTDKLVATFDQAIPGIEPDRIIVGSQGIFNLVTYELSGQELKARQGLYGQYRSADGETILAERVDDVRRLLWNAQSQPAPPFTVQWRGLIYVSQARKAALTASASDPTLITMDGQPSYSSLGEQPAVVPRDLLPGWHPIEIQLRGATAGGSFALQWVGSEGQSFPIASEDLFALSSLAGWTHVRTMEVNHQLVETQRFDFAPYFSSARVLELDATRTSVGSPARVVGETWSAVWHVPVGGEYQFVLEAASGAALVRLDGSTVIESATARNVRREARGVVSVSPGDHTLVVEQHHDEGDWTGATFAISRPDIPDYAPQLSPY